MKEIILETVDWLEQVATWFEQMPGTSRQAGTLRKMHAAKVRGRAALLKFQAENEEEKSDGMRPSSP